MNPDSHSADTPTIVHRVVLSVLLLIMTVELVFLFIEAQWMNVFLVIMIMAVTLSPGVLGRRFRVYIPSEFQVLAILFVFAALFLGEIQGYYGRIWWWDIALHTSSGFLMGILGFLLVYVLNESENISLQMQPRFVALFACLFAIVVGTLWEVFEFSMDQIVGTNMQKPMRGDPSGLTDTMWDMIVNAVGALCISGLGWWYMARRQQSFIEVWVHKFIQRNRHLFRL